MYFLFKIRRCRTCLIRLITLNRQDLSPVCFYLQNNTYPSAIKPPISTNTQKVFGKNTLISIPIPIQNKEKPSTHFIVKHPFLTIVCIPGLKLHDYSEASVSSALFSFLSESLFGVNLFTRSGTISRIFVMLS